MQVATLFRESTTLLGSSTSMESTTTAVETGTSTTGSVASPVPAMAIANTTPIADLSTLPTATTATPPPSSSSSSPPPLATAAASPTASTSSSSSVSSSSSSSASSASSCTPPSSTATTTSTSGPAPALTVTPPPPPPTPTEPVIATEHQQQPLSPPPQIQQEQPQLMVEATAASCGACHSQDVCHDAAEVPLDLCPSSLNVGGYDYSANNPAAANYSNKYKLNMKLEREDDGYETANSLPPRGGTADGGGNSSGGGEIKCEKLEDPYSFIDDDPMPILNSSNGSGVMQPHPIHMLQQPPPGLSGPPGPHHQQHQMPGIDDAGGMDGTTRPDDGSMLGSGGPPPYSMDSGMPYHYHMAIGPKKRGRKKKIKSDEPEFTTDPNGSTIPRPPKERKKHDRFNGMPEEEVSKRTLPDHITANLDIIIIGINPGLFAAYKGHHYAGPGNHFWKCLYLSGLTPQQMSAEEDYKLLQVGIGFTNMVARATKGSADLTRKEIKDGSQILLEKIKKFQPKIAVFNGKLIYEVFSGKKDFNFGRQPDLIEGTNTYMWVMPSSSARCAQLPRAADKVPFYAALKKFRDYLNGLVANIDDAELVFTEPRVKSCYEAEPRGDPLLFGSDTLTEVGDDNAVINRDEDGSVVNPAAAAAAAAAGLLPNKKKRGRPKKVKAEGNGEDISAPVVKVASQPRRNNNSNANNANSNCDFPKKKRGRPKKVKVALADDESDMDNINTNLLRSSGELNSSNNHGMHLGMGGSLSGHHPMLHAGPLNSLDNGTNNNHLSSAKCFSSPSPIQSPPPHHFYHHQQSQHHHPHQQQQHPHQQQQQPQLYSGYCLSPRPSHPHTPVLYHTTPNHNSSNSSQSPRPQSQPFTHSDLSSEISAAISSSEQLGSPPPSPGILGAPDFEPPTTMAEEDGGGASSRSVHGGDSGGAAGNGSSGECCRLSPATTPNSVGVEQQHYSSYHPTYGHHHHQQQQQFHVSAGMDHPGPPASSVGVVPAPPPPAPSTPDHHQQQQSPQPQVAHQQQQQDIAAKSLSGLESLVDQIPSITDGEAAVLSEPTDYSTHQFGHSGHQYRTGSPVADMGVGAAAFYGYGSTGSAAASYHHVPHQHLPAALYATPSWATAGSAYDSPHVPLPYQPSVYGHHGTPPVGVGVPPPPPPPPHHQGAYGAPGAAAGIHVPSPNYPSPYYGYPPQTHHHHGYHHHHHHPSYLGGF